MKKICQITQSKQIGLLKGHKITNPVFILSPLDTGIFAAETIR